MTMEEEEKDGKGIRGCWHRVNESALSKVEETRSQLFPGQTSSLQSADMCVFVALHTVAATFSSLHTPLFPKHV